MYSSAGLSTTGSSSFGIAFVAGRKRVPRPAAGITAFFTGMFGTLLPVGAAVSHPAPDAPSARERKAQLRRRLLAARGTGVVVDPAVILALPEMQQARVIASYAPLRGEPDVRAVNAALLARGLRVVLPELLPDRNLRFRDDAGTVDERTIGVMLVPAVAADACGRRLGRGGGSYDRVLSRAAAFTVAVVHADELLPEIPVEPHDVRVEAVLAGPVLHRLFTRLRCASAASPAGAPDARPPGRAGR